ncbi:hypothetical protein V6N11_075316 [Hibiscus sabdariffa]|uniref:Uncharacterized protein n=1 Tax=Hibiscus sabdariffa TaxID=183260 RepID=A0ABR2R6N3_9ROSI
MHPDDQHQPQEVTPSEQVPSWWTIEKVTWEARFAALEANNLETKGYMQRLIQLMSKEADTLSLDSKTPELTSPPSKASGKEDNQGMHENGPGIHGVDTSPETKEPKY